MQAHPSPKSRSQALTEFALVLPLLVVVALVSFQFVALFLAHLSVMNATRDVARWVAAHPHTLDTDVVAQLPPRVPPNIDPARLSLAVSPPCAALTGGQCPGRDRGGRVSVTLRYDASPLIFLPTEFGWAYLTVQVPRDLPPYTLHMMVQPA